MSMPATPAVAHEVRYDSLAAEWARITGRRSSDPAAYESQFTAMWAEHSALRAAGRWVSGPGDLLSVIGKAYDELVHSRVLAWLMTPTGRHGLGDRVVRSVLAAAWPDEEISLDGPVVSDLEVERTDLDEVTQLPTSARADIVLRLPGSVVVIENKVWAGEQPAQCERLYWAFANEAETVRYLFLTPSGRAPTTTTSDTARVAWRTLAYGTVLELLDAVLGAQDRDPALEAIAAVRQYAMTLRMRRIR